MKVGGKKEFGVIQMLTSKSTLWFSEQVLGSWLGLGKGGLDLGLDLG